MQSNELLPVVDEAGMVVGKAPRTRCHGPERLLHPVVHLHLFNDKGELLLQKRSELKTIQPGKWDTAVGGHVDYGERIAEALLREVREEIGLEDFSYSTVATYLFESEVERELIYCHKALAPEGFVPKITESDIDELRFFNQSEILDMISSGAVTPNFASEYLKYLSR